jgi:hypothetical protein
VEGDEANTEVIIGDTVIINDKIVIIDTSDNLLK